MSKEHQIFGQCKDCTWVVVPKKWFIFYPENWGNDPNWTIAYFSKGLVKNPPIRTTWIHSGCRISIQCCRNPAFRMRHLSRMVQLPTRYILRKTWCRWGLSLGCFRLGDASGWAALFQVVEVAGGGAVFFRGRPVVGRAAIFYYVLTTRRWDFQNLFFFGGERWA